jgi:hypothetical protein
MGLPFLLVRFLCQRKKPLTVWGYNAHYKISKVYIYGAIKVGQTVNRWQFRMPTTK